MTGRLVQTPRFLLLPALAVGLATALLGPAPSFSSPLGGESLGLDQRDFRLFDNFADPQASGSGVEHPQFPGGTGAQVAVWKAFVEWGSGPHGDGSGDPTQANLGDGGADFDPSWQGAALGVGSVNANVASAISSCGGGVIAFTEAPIVDGWRIRFCEEWVWSGGPGLPGVGELDLQGMATHQFGHALGLGHLGAGSVMAPLGSDGGNLRDLTPEDIAALQALYGPRSPGKPEITAARYLAKSGELELTGTGFATVGNEVWLTSAVPTAPDVDPRVVLTGVVATRGGTSIRIALPPAAGPGDVLVRIPGTGFHTLSNAFPVNVGRPEPRLPTNLVPTPRTRSLPATSRMPVGPRRARPVELPDGRLGWVLDPLPAAN